MGVLVHMETLRSLRVCPRKWVRSSALVFSLQLRRQGPSFRLSKSALSHEQAFLLFIFFFFSSRLHFCVCRFMRRRFALCACIHQIGVVQLWLSLCGCGCKCPIVGV